MEDQKGDICIETFETKHSQKQPSLGFNIVETRRKLKPAYTDLCQKELNQIILEKGKGEIAENYLKTIFSFAGDSRPVNPSDVKDSLFLCHESTYLIKEDDERNFQQHSFLEEVLETAKEANVETLLLIHTSLRYNLDVIYSAINEIKNKLCINFKIVILYGDSFIDTDCPLVRKKNYRQKNLEEI